MEMERSERWPAQHAPLRGRNPAQEPRPPGPCSIARVAQAGQEMSFLARWLRKHLEVFPTNLASTVALCIFYLTRL